MKYRIDCVIQQNYVAIVEAESEEEAVEKAEKHYEDNDGELGVFTEVTHTMEAQEADESELSYLTEIE